MPTLYKHWITQNTLNVWIEFGVFKSVNIHKIPLELRPNPEHKMFKCLHNVCTNIIKKINIFQIEHFEFFFFVKCKHLHWIENNVRTKCDWRIFIFVFFSISHLNSYMMNHNGTKTIFRQRISKYEIVSSLYSIGHANNNISSLGLLIKLVLHPKCYSTTTTTLCILVLRYIHL